LDFGLAKALTGQTAPSWGNPENSPTLTATQGGVILGTAAYMSPEQANGKAVDKRADIWSFGVVLYELLTGERLFTGSDVSEILAQVLTKQPDLAKVPQQARPLLRECLEKDPKKRLRDIGDAERQLVDEASETARSADRAASRSWTGRAGWMVAIVAGGFGAAILGVHFREKSPVLETARFEIGPPKDEQFTTHLTISPDGRKIAFPTQGNESGYRLWIRSLDTPEPKALVNTADAPFPFWSPDGKYIAFQVDGKLKKLDLSGGPAETLCEFPGDTKDFRGGSWNKDGVIVFGSANQGLRRVSASGGESAPLTALNASRQETGHLQPFFLPDGRHFLYLRASSQQENSGIYVGSLDAKPQDPARSLLAAKAPAIYAPALAASPGYLLFMRESALYAQQFDVNKLALIGESVSVADSVPISADHGYFWASATGTLIYRIGWIAPVPPWQLGSDLGRPVSGLVWLDRQGKIKIVSRLAGLADYRRVRLSRDESRAATVRYQGGPSDIWLVDSRGVSSRFTFDARTDDSPVWSPDGSRLAFSSNRAGHSDLYQKASNGTGEETLLFKSDEDKLPLSWSRDGRFLLFQWAQPKTNMGLWVLEISGGAKPDSAPKRLVPRAGNALAQPPLQRLAAEL
jgi:dipeptidyl aminopeptidase/acylaminoacyl peptidase